MSLQFVDSHCHLDLVQAQAATQDVSTFLENARANHVSHMLCVSVNLSQFPNVLSIAQSNENVFASVGVHPNERDEPETTTEQLVTLAAQQKIIAIGETGLDYFRSEGDLEWQRQRFRVHIAAAKQTGKPLIVHSRDAKEDTLRVLKEEGADTVGGVMHCFVEDWETAQRAMDLNFYISFSGIVTFKSATILHDVATRMPAERLLIETDSPYLAPMPHRGKLNQPAYVKHVAEYIAGLRKVSVEEIAETTTKNFFDLFKP